MKRISFLSILLALSCMYAGICPAADSSYGEEYDLWLGYKPLNGYSASEGTLKFCTSLKLPECKFKEIIGNELTSAISGILGKAPKIVTKGNAGIVFNQDGSIDAEGFRIMAAKDVLSISASTDIGFLYGCFRLIRELQCGRDLDGIDISDSPACPLRLVNHWDNIDRSVERGIGGISLWDWEQLPQTTERYSDYARALASVGINGIVLNNVNANAAILLPDYLTKVAALAGVFRAYGIKLYLSINLAAPLRQEASDTQKARWKGIGTLDTADPLNEAVQNWWKAKADEIYSLIPDFGGFLVKADSEGMPGPQSYGRSQAEGANMLARSLAPHGGIVMWRAFIYDSRKDSDRYKMAYDEFVPLDGQFDDNVIVQIKNGPLDFQPYEPAQPLFFAAPQTRKGAELQLNQEYLGQEQYLVYLAPWWKEFFDSIDPTSLSLIAGAANVGVSSCWTGHIFGQANFYAYGRFCWNPKDKLDSITMDWIGSTWHTDGAASKKIASMMNSSWKDYADSHNPMGLALTVETGAHFKAAFKSRNGGLWDANINGVGRDRTASTGSGFSAQFPEKLASRYEDPDECPEHLLLCFHFLPWSYKLSSGDSVGDTLYNGLDKGVNRVKKNIATWKSLKGAVDDVRYETVLKSLEGEQKAASEFRDAAKEFFGEFYPLF